jgi:hypothetical protein
MRELRPRHRQPGETDKTYQAFLTYRNLEPPFRSITRVVSELNKSRKLFGRWSSQWDWVERAAAWDEEQEIRLLAARVESKKMDEEHLRIVRSARPDRIKPSSGHACSSWSIMVLWGHVGRPSGYEPRRTGAGEHRPETCSMRLAGPGPRRDEHLGRQGRCRKGVLLTRR